MYTGSKRSFQTEWMGQDDSSQEISSASHYTSHISYIFKVMTGIMRNLHPMCDLLPSVCRHWYQSREHQQSYRQNLINMLILCKENNMFDVFPIINRPGVAGAVLQSTPLFYIDSLIKLPFCSESSWHMAQCISRSVRAGELKFLENFHPPLCITCHVSHDMCHMLGVICQVSSGTLFFLLV